MGIYAQNKTVAYLGGNAVEPLGGIVPLGRQTENVHFQGDVHFLDCLAEGKHVPAVRFIIARKIHQIGMGQIGEIAGAETPQHLGGVADQMLLLVGGEEIVLQTDLIIVQMLTEDQIVQVIRADQFNQILKQIRIILRLQTDLDVDSVLVFFLQGTDRAAVVLQFLRTHTEGGVVVAGEDLGCVIGEAQSGDAGGDGRLNIFSFRILRVTAPDGVGMVIVFHDDSRFCQRVGHKKVPYYDNTNPLAVQGRRREFSL